MGARAYVQACREIFPKLGDDVKLLLGGMLHSGELLSFLDMVYKRDFPRVTASECGARWRQKRPEEIEAARADYIGRAVYPLMEETIEPSQVLDAFAHGVVARIDGRKLLPPGAFDVTPAGLQELHPSSSPRILVHSEQAWAEGCATLLTQATRQAQQRGPRSLWETFARWVVIPWMLTFRCKNGSPSLTEYAEWFDGFHQDEIPWGSVYTPESLRSVGPAARMASKYTRLRQGLNSSNINLRRLPHFLPELDIAARVGLQGHAVAVHNFLWLGQTPGAFHQDQQDNILVQLRGRCEVIAFPPNCSFLLQGGQSKKNPLPAVAGHLNWTTRFVPVGQTRAPFFHVVLHPGQGLVMPSNTAHKVVARDSRRMAINAFFEPRYRRMRWPGAPANSFLRMDDRSIGLRVLWLRSLRQLWDTRGLVLAMHTLKMEFI